MQLLLDNIRIERTDISHFSLKNNQTFHNVHVEYTFVIRIHKIQLCESFYFIHEIITANRN